MVTQRTKGIDISVEVTFSNDHSNALQGLFIFQLEIRVENSNSFAVKLLGRHWQMFDSLPGEELKGTCYSELEADGVAGVTPIIKPRASYTYSTACKLRSEMGRVSGCFLLQNLETSGSFEAELPVFEMLSTAKMN
jgi:ApaG protein